MRYLTSTVCFAAAALAYVLGIGPAFFGAPLLGSALLLLGLGLEIAFWRRLRRSGSTSSSTTVTTR
ncbi:MAG: glycosyl transferase family 39 [Rhodanobacter sp.]